MINLKQLSNPTIRIDLGEQTIECYLPSEKLFRAMMSMEKASGEDVLEVFYSCITEIFNSNISRDVYEFADIKKFINLSLGGDIISQYLKGTQEHLGK